MLPIKVHVIVRFTARENMPTVSQSHKECLETRTGIYYEGTKSTTASGKTCLNWSDVWPEGENHNYCRNRLGQFTKPACWVTQISFELCDIPMCGK